MVVNAAYTGRLTVPSLGGLALSSSPSGGRSLFAAQRDFHKVSKPRGDGCLGLRTERKTVRFPLVRANSWRFRRRRRTRIDAGTQLTRGRR
jgi:hypothetical protein